MNDTQIATFETECLPAAHPEAMARAVEWLRRGSVIAFPTDTVYGAGAHAFQSEAVGQLFTVKDRPAGQAIPLLLADMDVMQEVCTDIPAEAWDLARSFWPGGLTLVLPRAAIVPDVVTAGGPTVAVRVPDHPVARELCRRLGAPIATTSANLHGLPSAVTAAEAKAMLGGRIPFILDGGPCPGGIASTVVDLCVRPAVLLRAGPVSGEQLAAVIALRA